MSRLFCAVIERQVTYRRKVTSRLRKPTNV